MAPLFEQHCPIRCPLIRRSGVFNYGKHTPPCPCIWRANRPFTGTDNIPVGRNREIERTEVRVGDEPARLNGIAWGERQDGIVTLAIRTDPGGEEQPAVATERKSTRKRYD